MGATVREWHALSPTDRRTAWVELVEWVIWLNDRYELSIEERLPHCWAEHPGLIEELAALKVWREEIYTATAPTGQAARYWHAELRQVIHAATTVYAVGCRAGHRTATHLAAADADLRARWLAADPLTGVPASLLGMNTGHPGNGDVLDTIAMRHAIARGDAQPLGELVTDFVHHDGTWWIPDRHANGWRRVTDPVFATDLDNAAARMAAADDIVARRRHGGSTSGEA